MLKTLCSVLLAAGALAACQAPAPLQRALLAPAHADAVRALKARSVAFAGFDTAPEGFSASCRGIGSLAFAEDLSAPQVIRRAFEDEFKAADALATGSARVTLTGSVDQLKFSSTQAMGTGGSWMISITLRSSNGKSFQMHEFYEFDTSLMPQEGCRRTADAYGRAVQNLVGKVVGNAEFAPLIR